MVIHCADWQKYGCGAMVKRRDIEVHNIAFETGHLRLQVAYLQKSHKEVISSLHLKHKREKQILTDQCEQDRQATENLWKRKFALSFFFFFFFAPFLFYEEKLY
ncbi:hypothetical protein RFI_28807 [Reticulomyxa filosa]|uniref:Uncharacterized protein n=1 Tax=Reticulomyxa filosa TaxID=46433 RepID=X6M3M8_RETFI|nr:hypothetical protein RFI_28807 [Reticulomyxa filosa]|eukprot:ETO08578.1 hypothetical protein RFI_28807 [Reticulomyxa filosa]